MIYKKYRTFSGTDTLVFIMLPNSEPICLGSISTISYSVFRVKKPVQLLGRVNVAGYTRGTRVVAGTIIFTLINQNWVNELRDRVPELKQYKDLKADELPLFDLMIVCANESGAFISGFINGVDVTDGAEKLSIEEMFSESTNSFVARDISLFEEGYVGGNNEIEYQNDIFIGSVEEHNGSSVIYKLQEKLFEIGYNVDGTGIYDKSTIEAIKNYQRDSGLVDDGMMDLFTIKSILKTNTDTDRLVNNNNIAVYDSVEFDKKQVSEYNKGDIITITGMKDDFFITTKGFVKKQKVESSVRFKPNIKSGNYTVSRNELFNDMFTAVVESEHDTKVKISAVAYKADKHYVYSKQVKVRSNTQYTLGTNNISEAFLYNEELGGLPEYVEVMLSSGNTVLKWRFNVNEQKEENL